MKMMSLTNRTTSSFHYFPILNFLLPGRCYPESYTNYYSECLDTFVVAVPCSPSYNLLQLHLVLLSKILVANLAGPVLERLPAGTMMALCRDRMVGGDRYHLDRRLHLRRSIPKRYHLL